MPSQSKMILRLRGTIRSIRAIASGPRYGHDSKNSNSRSGIQSSSATGMCRRTDSSTNPKDDARTSCPASAVTDPCVLANCPTMAIRFAAPISPPRMGMRHSSIGKRRDGLCILRDRLHPQPIAQLPIPGHHPPGLRSVHGLQTRPYLAELLVTFLHHGRQLRLTLTEPLVALDYVLDSALRPYRRLLDFCLKLDDASQCDIEPSCLA